MTQSIEQLRTLAAIAKNDYAPIGEADMMEAVRLNMQAQKPTIHALDMYAVSHPKVCFSAKRARLYAGMTAGWTLSDEDVSVI